MECKSQFCLPPAITGGCCQPPGSKFALSNNPNLRPKSSSAPKKHPKCGESFEFRGFPGLFSAVNKGIFGSAGAGGSTVLVVQRWVRAGVWVEFWGKINGFCAIPNPAAKAATGLAAWLSLLHGCTTLLILYSTIKLIIVSPIHQHLCVKAFLRFSTLVF